MTRYEAVVLLHPDLEINLDTPLKKITKLIKDSGGEVVKQDSWGKRKLAYPIRGEDFAVYVYWEIDMPTESVAKLDRSFNITDEIFRHLITKHVEVPESDKEDEAKETKSKKKASESEDK